MGSVWTEISHTYTYTCITISNNRISCYAAGTAVTIYIYIDIRLTIFWYALHAKPERRRKARGSSGICASCVFLKILRKNNRLKPLGRRDNRGIRDVTCCSILPIVPAVPSDGRSTSTALARRQAYTNDDDGGDDEQIDCGGVG